MLLTIAAILVILWLIGLIAHIGGAIIHFVLIVAVITAAWHFLQRNKAKA